MVDWDASDEEDPPPPGGQAGRRVQAAFQGLAEEGGRGRVIPRISPPGVIPPDAPSDNLPRAFMS
eukprot:9097657-Pyramimonas_sp.AAC.1